jgi:hypothetical protein
VNSALKQAGFALDGPAVAAMIEVGVRLAAALLVTPPPCLLPLTTPPPSATPCGRADAVAAP